MGPAPTLILLITRTSTGNSSMCLSTDGPPWHGGARHAGPADVVIHDHARADG